MTLSAWWLLAVALPVILLGEFIVRRVALLARFSIPVPVVGGLVVAIVVFALNLAGARVGFATKVDAGWWTWLPLTELEWAKRPAQALTLPFNVAFFTCIGLNASWSVARRGSWQLLWFLVIATVLLVLQNVLGVALAKLFGFSPVIGVLCGSVTMTGGHGTALGFADTLVAHGLPNAGVVGAAAATFGLICGSLVGGPVATLRIRQLRRAAGLADAPPQPMPPGHVTPLEAAIEPPYVEAAPATTASPDADVPVPSGFLHELRRLGALGSSVVVHLLILVACMKVGAWLSLGLRSLGLTFPIYMGAMVCGIVVRNALDALGKPVLVTTTVDLLAGVLLTLFLAMAMASLNLIELAGTAGPMAIVLGAQAILTPLFAYFVTFNAMGRDYDAAVMSAGHCGFGMGATPNAVANMEAVAERFGHAPRAFLVVSIVGAFLIDFTNSLAITLFLNVAK